MVSILLWKDDRPFKMETNLPWPKQRFPTINPDGKAKLFQVTQSDEIEILESDATAKCPYPNGILLLVGGLSPGGIKDEPQMCGVR